MSASPERIETAEKSQRLSRDCADYFQKVRRLAKPEYARRRPMPELGETKLLGLRIDALRWAVRTNQVSFPSQAPTFGKHDRADLQWRLAQLYFVCGWNCEGIAAKYGLIRQRVRQILNTWKRRAVETGHIQFIPPVNFETVRLELSTPRVTRRRIADPRYGTVPATRRVVANSETR
jgi:hypothetical protein